MTEIVCKRCGKCCYYMKHSKLKKCKHLVKLSSGKTLCRVYHNRQGRLIDEFDGKTIGCLDRDKGQWDYEGCPYNTNKEILW